MSNLLSSMFGAAPSSGDPNNLGYFISVAALESAHPTATAGDWAIVDPVGVDASKYIWDVDSAAWVQSGNVAGSVIGPASSTTNAASLFADTTGELLKDSSILADSTGSVLLSTAAVFSASTTTAIEGIKRRYVCDDTSAPNNFEISITDVPTGSATNHWDFDVVDESGGAEGNPITIKSTDVTIISVAAGPIFTTSSAHGMQIGALIVQSTFTEPTYNVVGVITDVPTADSYEISAITFIATDTGIANLAISGESFILLDTDYGATRLYSNGLNPFTR